MRDWTSILSRPYVVDEAKEEQYRRLAELRTAIANLSACLRIAGALASAWNRGAMNGAAWASGREVLRRFGPEAPR